MPEAKVRNQRKTLVVVVSDKMDKPGRVERLVQHPFIAGPCGRQ